MHREQQGDTHIWVLRAQCWLRGGGGVGEGGETEKQKKRFVSRVRGCPVLGRASGRQLWSSVETQGPPAPVACQHGFWGDHLWPAWASTKPKPCGPPRPRPVPRPPMQGSSARNKAGAGTGSEGPRWQPDPPQSRRESQEGGQAGPGGPWGPTAWSPCPGQADADTHCR